LINFKYLHCVSFLRNKFFSFYCRTFIILHTVVKYTCRIHKDTKGQEYFSTSAFKHCICMLFQLKLYFLTVVNVKLPYLFVLFLFKGLTFYSLFQFHLVSTYYFFNELSTEYKPKSILYFCFKTHNNFIYMATNLDIHLI
jgi:hypothetical protein